MTRSATPSRPDFSTPRPFWDHLADHGGALALLDPHSGLELTYRALAAAVDAVAERLAHPGKRLVLLRADNGIDCIVALLAALRASHALFLVGRSAPTGAVLRLLDEYRPDLVISDASGAPSGDRWRAPSALYGRLTCTAARAEADAEPREDLALILSTSGSVGSPKSVRLSRSNVAANAGQIAQALHIRPGSRAALSLPLAYTYGLSVLTSHLLAGGVLVVQDRSVIDPLFWRGCAAGAVETLPTVNFILDFMAGPRWPDLRPPALKAVTHSGSRIGAKAVQWLDEVTRQGTLDAFKMYGMTEGTARLSVLPSEDFPAHPYSVGRPVPGGAFEIEADGQIIYRGPNVMMGYAETRADLALGDQLQGRLETGDTGRLDEDGRLTVTGRLHRFAKILGLRLNLADMEDYLSRDGEAAVVSDDQRIVVYHTLAPEAPLGTLRASFCAEFRLPPQMVAWRRLERLPRAQSGKILYGELAC